MPRIKFTKLDRCRNTNGFAQEPTSTFDSFFGGKAWTLNGFRKSFEISLIIIALMASSIIFVSFPVNISSVVQTDSVLRYISNLETFSVIFYIFIVATFGSMLVLHKSGRDNLIILPVMTFSLTFVDFWRFHTYLGLQPPGDGISRLLDLAFTVQAGRVQFNSNIYYGFPGLDIIGTFGHFVTDLSLSNTADFLTFFAVGTLALSLFVLFTTLLADNFAAGIATILIVEGDILVVHSYQLFFPANFGFLLFIITLLVFLRLLHIRRSSQEGIIFGVLLAGGALIHPADPPIIVGMLFLAMLLVKGASYYIKRVFIMSVVIVTAVDSRTAILNSLSLLVKVHTGTLPSISSSPLHSYLQYFERLTSGNLFSAGLPLWVTLPQSFWLVILLSPSVLILSFIYNRRSQLMAFYFCVVSSSFLFTLATFAAGYGDPTRVLEYFPLATAPLLLLKIGDHRKSLLLFLIVTIVAAEPTFMAFNIVQPAYSVSSYQYPYFLSFLQPQSLVFTDSIEGSLIQYSTYSQVSISYPSIYFNNASKSISSLESFISSPLSCQCGTTVFVLYPTFVYNLIHFYPSVNTSTLNYSRLYSDDLTYSNGRLMIFAI
jgi:hypothetical protein